MPTGRIDSVNVGAIARLEINAEPVETAINKRAVRGRVFVGKLGLAGDTQVDKELHGGPEQAVYAYAREDLDWWTEQAKREFANGEFGENLTTAGLDVTGALIGEVWQVGPDVVVQVTAPRVPCRVFAAWTGEHHWVKRFAAARRPGAYLRVLAEGEVGAGDRIEVLSRPDQQVTIAESMSAFYGDPDLMRVLLTVEGRGGQWDAIGADVLGRAAV